MSEIKLSLTHPQWKKLHGGKTVTITPSSIGSGLKLRLPTDKVKKLKDAKNKNKSIRLSMTDDERILAGNGFRDVLSKISNGYKKFVKPIVGPVIRQGLKSAVQTGLPALAGALGQPELIPIASTIANTIGNQAVDKLGDVTGAYGLRHKGGYKLSDNYSLKVGPMHPAFHPHLPLADHSKPNNITNGGRLLLHVSSHGKRVKLHGGSFLPS